ncbi:hypothetical protein [Rothia uropygialis]|uniref:hypothetical protein n=1 Tax=Kocuria sp. 36 TaxID=1415402 RepID=UPI00101C7F59|nr:hypothetical protein [Kocuria sp. 36]
MRTATVFRASTAAAVAILALAGCSAHDDGQDQDKDRKAAEQVARDYTTGTYEQQCQETHPDSDMSSTDCASSANAKEKPWPGHPTDISETKAWDGDGYAVVIPDQQGRKTVIGLKKSQDHWKVLNVGYISTEDQQHSDPACWALSSTDGADCNG